MSGIQTWQLAPSNQQALLYKCCGCVHLLWLGLFSGPKLKAYQVVGKIPGMVPIGHQSPPNVLNPKFQKPPTTPCSRRCRCLRFNPWSQGKRLCSQNLGLLLFKPKTGVGWLAACLPVRPCPPAGDEQNKGRGARRKHGVSSLIKENTDRWRANKQETDHPPGRLAQPADASAPRCPCNHASQRDAARRCPWSRSWRRCSAPSAASQTGGPQPARVEGGKGGWRELAFQLLSSEWETLLVLKREKNKLGEGLLISGTPPSCAAPAPSR